jgi:hypothetical protein
MKNECVTPSSYYFSNSTDVLQNHLFCVAKPAVQQTRSANRPWLCSALASFAMMQNNILKNIM